ncbi:hypothetical protein CH063_09561 [Colletotrichum higginsianum]|uniref:Uncharacterized protein n=1 Tax=Colletotrichum higginsianum (strain IMI 349063) TaxID=759273 RepID=H1VE27_COLHI|nr:hypothetical protein CH063_09561 [Colletotrichum higginsianum]
MWLLSSARTAPRRRLSPLHLVLLLKGLLWDGGESLMCQSRHKRASRERTTFDGAHPRPPSWWCRFGGAGFFQTPQIPSNGRVPGLPDARERCLADEVAHVSSDSALAETGAEGRVRHEIGRDAGDLWSGEGCARVGHQLGGLFVVGTPDILADGPGGDEVSLLTEIGLFECPVDRADHDHGQVLGQEGRQAVHLDNLSPYPLVARRADDGDIQAHESLHRIADPSMMCGKCGRA